MTMTEKYKILAKYIKDISSETPNIETYLFAKENISKYQLSIDINSKAIKDKHLEINTSLKYEDKSNKRKSYFEIVFSTIIRVNENIKETKELQKIVLCDVQNEIYPDLEKSLITLLSMSGYPGLKFEKKIDFNNLYKKQFN